MKKGPLKATVDNVALAAMVFAVVAIIAVSTVAVISAENLITTNESVLRTQRMISSLEAIRYHSLALDAGERNFIVSGDPRDLSPFHASVGELDGELEFLGARKADGVYSAGQFGALQDSVRTLMKVEREIVETRRKSGAEAARTQSLRHADDNLHEKVLANTISMLQSARRQSEQLEQAQIAFGDKVRRLILALISSSAFILIFLYGTLNRLHQEQRAAQELIAHQATHDALTGLYNRAAVVDHLDERVSDDSTTALGGMAVLLLDLDGFKAVNDSLGHDAGDELLRQVATRLSQALRDSDFLARLGGDEFLVVIPQVSEDENAARVAEKLIAVIDRPFALGSNESTVTTSVGISVFPRDGHTREQLMKCADLALYEAKHAGRNQYRRFETGQRGGLRLD